MTRPPLAAHWGTDVHERSMPAAADALVPGADEIWLRVVDIAAPAGAGSALLPRMAVSYTLTARGDTACRLVVRIAIDAPRAVPGPLGRAALAALRVGDLVMMRRRLLTLRALAERDARRAATGPRPG